MKATRPKASRNHRPAPGKAESRPPSLLVVDDDREITYLLAEVLRPAGYIVLEANSAAEAARIAQHHNLDAALIDVWMPDADGYEVLRTLREHNEHLVAVMMTGYATLGGARRAMRLGAYEYITKPFDTQALRAVLKAGLDETTHARMRQPPEAASPAALRSPDP